MSLTIGELLKAKHDVSGESRDESGEWTAGGDKAPLETKPDGALKDLDMHVIKFVAKGAGYSTAASAIDMRRAINRYVGSADDEGIPAEHIQESNDKFKSGRAEMEQKGITLADRNPELAAIVGNNPSREDMVNHVLGTLKRIHPHIAEQFDKAHPDGARLYRGISKATYKHLLEVYTRATGGSGGSDVVKLRPILSTSGQLAVAARFSNGEYSDKEGGLYIIQFNKVHGDRVIGAHDLPLTKEAYEDYAGSEQEVSLFGSAPWRVEQAGTTETGDGTKIHFVRLEPADKTEKSMSTSVIEGAGKPQTAADLVKLITYDQKTGIRRLRDDDGKFTGRASEAGVPDSVLNAEPGTKHAVFTMGGPGAGKTGIVSMYVGTPPGKPMKRFGSGPNIPTKPKVTRELELHPLEGFSQENVVDCDRHKKMLKGLYSDHVLADGTRGPSGPKTKDDFDKLPQESQLSALESVRKLGFPSIEAFAMTLPENAGKPPEEASRSYAGGLTHELSTEAAERQYRSLLDGNKSFVYDAVGNPTRYERMVHEALAKGFHVILHHADSDLENNQENNYWRDRTVDPKVVMAGYSKSQMASHHLESLARSLKGQGFPIEFLRTKTNTEKQRQGAANRGWSPTGPMPGTQAAALPPWDQKHKVGEVAPA